MNCKGEMLGNTCYETKWTYPEDECGPDTKDLDFTNKKDLYYLNGNCQNRSISYFTNLCVSAKIKKMNEDEITLWWKGRQACSTVQCTVTIDDEVVEVLYNEEQLEVKGNKRDWSKPKTFSFQSCFSKKEGVGVLKILGRNSAVTNHCETGGMILICKADDDFNPWHNFVSDDVNWQVEEGESICLDNSRDKGFLNSDIEFIIEALDDGANKIWAQRGEITFIGSPSKFEISISFHYFFNLLTLGYPSMNCEWLKSDYAINEHKYIEYSDVKSQFDCAVQCMSTRYATHAFYMEGTPEEFIDSSPTKPLTQIRRSRNLRPIPKPVTVPPLFLDFLDDILNEKCLCMFEYGNLTSQDQEELMIEVGSKTDLRTCIENFRPYSLGKYSSMNFYGIS